LNDHLWSARLLRDDPELIYQTHLAYYLAGADFATSASYQATVSGFEKAGIRAADGEALIRSSVVLARRARDEAWAQMRVDSRDASVARSRPLVAASIGCYGASLADGSEYRGDYSLTLEELKEFHSRRLLLLAEEQPDVFACETVPCLREVEALLQLLMQVNTCAPCSFSFLPVPARGGGLSS
jgi:homocysteine S-methyltransferase